MTMKYKEMDRLLKAFYEGLATDEEENRLTEYFLGEDIAPEHLPEKELFLELAGLGDTKAFPEPDTFRFEQFLTLLEAGSEVKRIPPKPEVRYGRKKIIGMWASGIAASVIFVAAGVFFFCETFKKSPEQMYTEEEVAHKIQAMEEALKSVSANLSTGLEQINVVGETFTASARTLNNKDY